LDEKFSQLKVFPLIDTSFPNNQEYAEIFQVEITQTIVYKPLNLINAIDSIKDVSQIDLNYHHGFQSSISQESNYHLFNFWPSGDDWKMVFNDIVLTYLQKSCIFNNNIQYYRKMVLY
jgi:hypothetical protein